jgi:hypothetical protein
MTQENGKGSEDNPENNAASGDLPIVPQAPEYQELETLEPNQEANQPGSQEEVPIWTRTRNWFRRKSDEANLTDWLMAFFTFVLAATTIVFTVYAKRQWREMHDAGTQTDRIIAADERMAKAMEDSVKQGQRAFDAANKQAILGERAWLGTKPLLQTGRGRIEIGQPLNVRIITKNTGKTPAIHVGAYTARDAVTKNKAGIFEPPSFEYKRKNFVIAGNVPPDGEIYSDFFAEKLSQEDYDRIMTEKVRVYVHGRVEYTDVFGVAHWANFCNFLLSGGGFAICPYHNEIDQNEK